MEKSNFLGVKTIFEIFENEKDKKDDDKEDEFDIFYSSKYRNIKYDSYDYMSIRGHSKSIKDDDLYEEEKEYFTEMGINLYSSLKESDLEFDNKKSFTKTVDEKINKYDINLINDYYSINILMVAEKPLIAYKIAKILSYGKFNQYCIDDMKIYTFKRSFKRRRAYFTVTSVKGHIYNNQYEKKYDKFYPEESYEYNIIKILKNDKLNIPRFLRCISKNKDLLILWIDCDPEGENICYEIIQNVLPYMNRKDYQQIYRAIFSSLTDIDILNSFDDLREYFRNSSLF